MRQRGDVISGGSYASTSDPRLHFGLGDSTMIEALEVHWPSGAKENFSVLKWTGSSLSPRERDEALTCHLRLNL